MGVHAQLCAASVFRDVGVMDFIVFDGQKMLSIKSLMRSIKSDISHAHAG